TNEDADDQGNNSAAAIILVDPVLTPDDTTFLSNQPVIVPPPPTATSSASFEIEGNLVVDTFGNLDWANAPDLQIGIDLPTGQTDDSFGQGTKENSAVPTAVTGSVPNNKSDLTRFYVASNISMNGDIFVYLGWERANTLGTANIDFEFNQSDVPSSNGVTPVRTVGDMLITFDFASGGNVVNLGLRRWTGSAWGPSIDLTAAGFAIGAVNDPAFGQTTVLDPITGQTLAQDTFGEASINLTAARVFTSDVCVHFGSAYVKSRSSTSFTAEMKDFIAPIGVNINNCPDVHVRKTVGDTGRTTGTVTAGDPVSLTLVVSNDGAGTAQNVSLSDILPDGVTWSEDSLFTSISIVNGHQVLTGNFGNMVSGASFTIHVSGVTDINSCGKLRNEAFVSATNEPDDDQTDNRGAAIILVNPVLTADDISFLNGGGAPMLAASLGSGSGTAGLSEEMLQTIVTQAINYWRDIGVTQEQLAALETQTIYIVNLPYGELGWTRGNATWIDRTAQGWGWSVTGAPDRMDLLTVVTHELGHVLGLPPTATGLMEVYLMPGVRLVPAAVLSTGNVAVVAASTGDSGGSAGATANNLPAGLVVEEFGVGVRSESLATASTDSLDAAFATVVDPGVTLAGPRTGEAVPSALPAAASVAQTGGSTHRGLTATVNVVPDGSGTQRELTAVLSERSPQAALPVATLLPSAFRGLDQGFAAVLLPSRGPSSSAVEPGSNGVPADEPEEAEAAGWPLARENSAPARLQWAVAAQAEARWQQLAGDACFADGSWALGGSDGDVPVSTGIVAEARPGSDSAIALAALVVAMGGLSWRVDDAESEPRRRRSLR
ncbi:MAG TPA: hypothetical protein VEL76_28085, partial [Gemmataceae bacterium]|nr:hypothetical protein [Gemmataceae bacterium]